MLWRRALWFRSPVADVISAGVVDFDDNKHVLEMRADVLGREGESSRLLEHDGDDVVANVSLPQQLGGLESRGRNQRHAMVRAPGESKQMKTKICTDKKYFRGDFQVSSNNKPLKCRQ